MPLSLRKVERAHLSGRERSRSVSCSSPTVGGSSSLRSTSRALGRSAGFAAVSHLIRRATCASHTCASYAFFLYSCFMSKVCLATLSFADFVILRVSLANIHSSSDTVYFMSPPACLTPERGSANLIYQVIVAFRNLQSTWIVVCTLQRSGTNGFVTGLEVRGQV